MEKANDQAKKELDVYKAKVLEAEKQNFSQEEKLMPKKVKPIAEIIKMSKEKQV